MDYAYRWQQNSAEYQWLKHDLQTHPSQLKFAIWHYPLYSDNFTEPSDTFLQGRSSLEGLLTDNGVNMVFNGHAHMYERNVKTSAGLVTYVTGGGARSPSRSRTASRTTRTGSGGARRAAASAAPQRSRP
jgi:hypothetical protein